MRRVEAANPSLTVGALSLAPEFSATFAANFMMQVLKVCRPAVEGLGGEANRRRRASATVCVEVSQRKATTSPKNPPSAPAASTRLCFLRWARSICSAEDCGSTRIATERCNSVSSARYLIESPCSARFSITRLRAQFAQFLPSKQHPRPRTRHPLVVADKGFQHDGIPA